MIGKKEPQPDAGGSACRRDQRKFGKGKGDVLHARGRAIAVPDFAVAGQATLCNVRQVEGSPPRGAGVARLAPLNPFDFDFDFDAACGSMSTPIATAVSKGRPEGMR
jgi:hypothetical protein